MKLRHSPGRHWHWCAGCEVLHPLPDEGWTFNGNLDAPTFTPSFLQYENSRHGRCHYILTDGVLNFCGDSGHALAGQSIPLPDLPPHAQDKLDSFLAD